MDIIELNNLIHQRRSIFPPMYSDRQLSDYRKIDELSLSSKSTEANHMKWL